MNKIREVPGYESILVTHTDQAELFVWSLERQPDRAYEKVPLHQLHVENGRGAWSVTHDCTLIDQETGMILLEAQIDAASAGSCFGNGQFGHLLLPGPVAHA